MVVDRMSTSSHQQLSTSDNWVGDIYRVKLKIRIADENGEMIMMLGICLGHKSLAFQFWDSDYCPFSLYSETSQAVSVVESENIFRCANKIKRACWAILIG